MKKQRKIIVDTNELRKFLKSYGKTMSNLKDNYIDGDTKVASGSVQKRFNREMSPEKFDNLRYNVERLTGSTLTSEDFERKFSISRHDEYEDIELIKENIKKLTAKVSIDDEVDDIFDMYLNLPQDDKTDIMEILLYEKSNAKKEQMKIILIFCAENITSDGVDDLYASTLRSVLRAILLLRTKGLWIEVALVGTETATQRIDPIWLKLTRPIQQPVDPDQGWVHRPLPNGLVSFGLQHAPEWLINLGEIIPWLNLTAVGQINEDFSKTNRFDPLEMALGTWLRKELIEALQLSSGDPYRKKSLYRAIRAMAGSTFLPLSDDRKASNRRWWSIAIESVRQVLEKEWVLHPDPIYTEWQALLNAAAENASSSPGVRLIVGDSGYWYKALVPNTELPPYEEPLREAAKKYPSLVERRFVISESRATKIANSQHEFDEFRKILDSMLEHGISVSITKQEEILGNYPNQWDDFGIIHDTVIRFKDSENIELRRMSLSNKEKIEAERVWRKLAPIWSSEGEIALTYEFIKDKFSHSR